MRLPTIPRKEYVRKNKFYPNGKLTIMPYTVREESFLLQVANSEDPEEQLLAVKQLIEGCLKDDIDVSNLPTFVLEDLFIRLREISAGEILKLTYRCSNKVSVEREDSEGNKSTVEEPCRNIVDFNFDLRKFILTENKSHDLVVPITDTIGIKFKYPNLDIITEFDSTNDENKFIIDCIECIYEDDDVFYPKDSSQEELMEFIKTISLEAKEEIRKKFIYTMPKLHFDTDLVCSKCGHKNHLSFNSINDIFG